MTRFRYPAILSIAFLLLSVSSANESYRRSQRSLGSTTDNQFMVYDECLSGQDSRQTIQCVSDKLESNQKDLKKDVYTWLTIFAAALIFFMQAGFAMLCAGSVRLKNVGNTMLKNLLDACGAALGFFSIGFAFAFGGQDETTATTFIGTSNFFMQGTCLTFHSCMHREFFGRVSQGGFELL